uniref:Engulfment and cell motility 2 n=1 Tax=Astyanax mexicanus TaxID=7994 RepID=A0A8B9HTI7_ASTMX
EPEKRHPLFVSLFVYLFVRWSLSGSEQFALRYADGPQSSGSARQLLDRIQSHGIDARLEALKELAKLSADPTFATEFINMEGIGTLARLVESGTHFGEMLAFTLTAFLELMDHGIVSWDLISLSFIKQAQRDVIFELRRIAFDGENDPTGTEKRKAMYTKDYKMLGFTNHVNPAMDFTQTPPGMLALDNMLYLAKLHQDTYIRIVLENSSREDKHECPFGRCAIELTRMLCEILQVGELPNEGCNDYHPMFFTHDRAWEEFFCVCIQLLNKTWKEMRATAEDFNKVMQVVREQITRALAMKPSSLEQLKGKLRSLSYAEILRLRQSERMSQDDFQSAPIIELRERIQPEILELIKQQRLNRLCEGSCFRKLGNRRRQEKFWFCRLSLNHKVLHYGDLDESPQGEVPFELLTDKIPVSDIKSVVTGKDCPHMKEKSALKQNKEVLELAFSILYDPDEALNFVAPSKYEYCIWTDGLCALLGREMGSDLTRSDLDTLISMEMKLRLLDLENITIPEAPPPVPKEPSSYNFTYNYG